MTDTFTEDDLPPRDADEALAAEYVLGVLALDERLSVEKRMASDTAFADQVAAWQNRMSPLNEDFVVVPPSPDVWAKIDSRLFPAPAPKPRLWFRWFAGMATAALLVLAAIIVYPLREPAMVVTLTTPDQSLVYQAAFLDDALTVRRTAGSAAADGQVHELWIIAPNAAPVSLGLLAEAPLTLPYPEPPKGWVLAVSVEPEGGSPIGSPTGPVILTAEIGA